jgi:hypothetical protein
VRMRVLDITGGVAVGRHSAKVSSARTSGRGMFAKWA